ncbi:MAG: hypothetical protein ABI128_02990 [Rhodanobacter sp.]
MHIQRFIPILLASLLTTAAWAQTAEKPLNLKLAPSSVPASSSSAAATASAATAVSPTATNGPANSAPGVYYGDTSGRMGNNEVAGDGGRACDDSAYNKPQVHGSVGMGVIGGNHVSGNYQTGSVSVSKAFGSCDDPKGGVSFSASSGTGNFHGRGH